MTLVEFYEVAEELIISLQYFNLKQKEENMLKRLNSLGKFEVQFNHLILWCNFNTLNIEKRNRDMDNMCIICLDNPNNIVLPCTHSYCNEWIKEWRQFHKSCPLCRHSITNDGNQVSTEDRLTESWKYELISIEKDSTQEIEMDNMMKQKLASCISYLENLEH